MPSERELREQICETTRILYDRGHNAPMDGNVSARLSERYLLCTPTGVHKGRLHANQVVKVTAAEGRPVDDAQRASSEIRMHVAIYAARRDVNAIVHAHSPNAVGLSVAGFSMEQPVVPEAILALGGVPTVPYASPTTPDVPARVIEHVRNAAAFILERHGPVALGDTMAQALSRLEIVEHTARITIAALVAGRGAATPIAADEAAKLRKMAETLGVAPPRSEDDLIETLVARVVERLRRS